MNKSAGKEQIPMYLMFLCGSFSSMTAEACTLPIDITKIRLQLQGELERNAVRKYKGMLHALYLIAKEEGPRSLYKGGSPALLRQFVYSGTFEENHHLLTVFFSRTESEHLRTYKAFTWDV